MISIRRSGALLALALLAAACAEPGPTGSFEPALQLAKGGQGGGPKCPATPTVVAGTEGDLLAAIATAAPGDVIGVNGTIVVDSDIIFLDTPGVTLTCASDGAGLVAGPGMPFSYMIYPWAPDVTVSHLVIDAVIRPGGAIRGHFNGGDAFGADVTVVGNDVTCDRICLFFSGVERATITDNVFTSTSGHSGLHIQGSGVLLPDGAFPNRIDGTTVARNTLHALAAPEGCSHLGAIRIRDGRDVTVSHNVVTGPFRNSLTPTDITESRFEHNRLEGATCRGIGIAMVRFVPLSVFDNVFRNNQVSGSGDVLLRAFNGTCGNTFIGNNIRQDAQDFGAIFDEQTGANVLVGNRNVVVDNGSFDCDGDGGIDPNVITGRGAVLAGVDLGRAVSSAAVASGAAGPH